MSGTSSSATHRGQTSEKQAAKASQTDRRIERLEVVEEPRKEWELRMSIAAARRAGAVVATLRGAVVRRAAFRLGPVDAQLDWADRIAITGANGSGKSTLLGALLGTLELDEGSASLGPGVRIGQVDQARTLFLGGEPLAAAFRTEIPDWPEQEIRTLLAKFSLGGAATATSDRPSRCPPASAPAPHWPCCRPARSTCWCSTSRPTTWTWRPSSSWSPRWTRSPAPCCWSPMTAACWRPSE